jgi:Putative rRNA methylase
VCWMLRSFHPYHTAVTSMHVSDVVEAFLARRPALPQQVVLQREGAARPALVCFNLGWMPGQPDGCKEIKTETSTTLEALRQAHDMVADSGSVSVVAYTGHEGKCWTHSLSIFMMLINIQQWRVF